MLSEELLGVFTPLTETDVTVAEPGTCLLDDVVLDGEVDKVTRDRDACVEHDVEFGHPEGWRHLDLHDLGANTVSDVLVTILDGADATNVDSNRRVELECAATGG